MCVRMDAHSYLFADLNLIKLVECRGYENFQ